ncbi:hypothetical protein FBUS_02186 [Fasciolopsis buskii]|uniref:NADH dehydrogenase subunit 6 n=1 Tax=Fasciolopsis buskii TaxID=27845 RepID=A0A8E0S6D8_9TREM|nr:hypothetical protein FBUS_02186 [Fasciolopsis buski]
MGAPLLKILLLINLCLGIILACIALGKNPTNYVSPRTSNWNAVIAFNSLALIFLVGALVINILLFVGFTEKYQMFMIIITVFVGIGCVCFAIATGVAYVGTYATHSAWLLSGTWMTIMSIVISIIYIFVSLD